MLKTCKKGHRFFKTSDCPTCPVCEAERKPKDGFLSRLGAPARRALEKKGILKVQDLSKYTKDEVLKFHGIGKSSLPVLLEALNGKGLKFRGD